MDRGGDRDEEAKSGTTPDVTNDTRGNKGVHRF